MFAKNQKLDKFLIKLNQALLPTETKLEEEYADKGKQLPTVIKIGLPRVGGTLLTQWAASSGSFYLPSNFLSRFYAVPCTGVLIEKLLRNPEYDYKDEFSDINRDIQFFSDIGKTSGLLALHEFWYFWRHRLHLPDIPTTQEKFIKKSNLYTFNHSLNALKGIIGKPLFLKAHLVNFYLESFSKHVDNFIYFHLKRNLLDVAQSLYFARLKWHQNENKWFSHKPRNFHSLKVLDPIYQVVGQVYFIEKATLQAIPTLGDRCFEASYRDLCESPEDVYKRLTAVIQKKTQFQISDAYCGEKKFNFKSNPDPLLRPKMEKALDYFISNYGKL